MGPTREGLINVKLQPLNPPARSQYKYERIRGPVDIKSGLNPVTGGVHRYISSLPNEAAWSLVGGIISLIRDLTGLRLVPPPKAYNLTHTMIIFLGSESATLESLFLATCLVNLRNPEYKHPDVEHMTLTSNGRLRYLEVFAHYDAYFTLYGFRTQMLAAMLLELLWLYRGDCIERPNFNRPPISLENTLPTPAQVRAVEERFALAKQSKLYSPSAETISSATSSDTSLQSDWERFQQEEKRQDSSSRRSLGSKRRVRPSTSPILATSFSEANTTPLGIASSFKSPNQAFTSARAEGYAVSNYSGKQPGSSDSGSSSRRMSIDEYIETDKENFPNASTTIFNKTKITDASNLTAPSLANDSTYLPCKGCKESMTTKETLLLGCKHLLCSVCWILMDDCPICHAALPRNKPTIVDLSTA